MKSRRFRRIVCSTMIASASVVGSVTVLRGQGTGGGGESYAERCGAAGPAAERGSYIPLPRGEVFCPLIADPKAMRSFVSYQRGKETDLAADIAAVGIADQFPFFRAGAVRRGNGVQLGLSGAVFAQFDIGKSSYDLLNADYLIALPLSFRAGAFSGRARVYHQSSHLGDEVLLRENPPKRENLSFESAELLLSVDVSALRLYGGGEYFFHRTPDDLADHLLHGGIELRPRGAVNFGTLAVGRVVAAADVKLVNDTSSHTGISARAGFEFGRPHSGENPSRRWSILGEFYEGPAPYGQFHRRKVRLVGAGFYFTL